MAQYFNRESSSLAVTLRTGKVCTIPGKSWIEIAAEDEGSEDLVRIMQRGFVYRFAPEEHEPQKVPTSEVVVTASSLEPVAEVSASPADTAASSSSEVVKEETQDQTPEKISELQRRKKV